ncbi:hypothetical protein [Chryseotalea sanaruensis]|uniref:hypothetical protein n=1 Tax=Chryseotalea sanaruensis TaxID=2482724 RepID=UPI000F8F0054|nr:hypothetical protein [Chryseotalea sanaruensis]
MKTSFKHLLLFVLLLILAFACKDDPSVTPPTEAELRTEILTAGNGTWNIPASDGVLLGEGVNTIDIGELFQNFSITFTTTGYTTTGTTPVWARSGTWSFVDNSGTKFRRNDNIEVTIVDISANTVKLTLQWNETTYEDGRNKSLAGLHTFTFNK